MKKEKIPSISVLGSLHIDLVNKTKRIPEVGETVWGGKFKMTPGGKGANQAVAASRLGAEVKLLGKIGSDYFGEILVDNIANEGIPTNNLISNDEFHTGVAEIIVDSKGRNIISVAPGANAELTVNDLESKTDFFESSDLFLTQLEIPVEVVEYALEKASENGLKTILNPAPAKEISDKILRNVDILVPNRIELMDIAGEGRTSNSLKEAARDILKRGPEAIVVTLGEDGALLVSDEEATKFEGTKIEAMDTTGAGDAFCAGLATSMASGKSLQESVKTGNLAGALTTTKLGAQEALPTYQELSDFKKEIN
ncbi:hypothetical protein AKJ54_00010 [candidate division MSBL1 archaeon SCGC-AAA382K21]|uniref:Ribokinase n=1 Tax=candidate division MSBL1 archaeon SCGC-AAA382K21 TaxID=1698283 RepID=A0A133VMA4_9EURY|nr:hypothetical protein AKJ54_00010 [candidate division MSBL1 archaeon SCGC-AAA382K21]